MSKSLKRVAQALAAAGADVDILEMAEGTRTAADAAKAAGCALDQIVKSIIFRGGDTGRAVVFLTAGGNRVNAEKASRVAEQVLERADAAFVRAETGFAIGGVAPLGHLTKPAIFHDPRLLAFETVWAAAGTPRHIFAIHPRILVKICQSQAADFTS